MRLRSLLWRVWQKLSCMSSLRRPVKGAFYLSYLCCWQGWSTPLNFSIFCIGWFFSGFEASAYPLWVYHIYIYTHTYTWYVKRLWIYSHCLEYAACLANCNGRGNKLGDLFTFPHLNFSIFCISWFFSGSKDSVCVCLYIYIYIYIYKRITCSNFPGGLLHAQERQAWGETERGLPKEHRSQFYPSWTSICQAWCGCGQNDRQVHGNLRSWKSSRVHLQDFPVQGGCRLLVRYHAQSHAKRQVGWEFGNSTKSWSNQESNGSSSWEDPQGKHQHGRWDQQEVCPKGNRGERLFRSHFHQEEWSATTFKNPGVQAIAGSDFAHCRGACCWGLRPCYVAFNSWMASSDMHLDGRQVHRKASGRVHEGI